MKLSAVPGERAIDKPDHPPQGFVFTMSAETESIEGEAQLKVGRQGKFEFYSDESERMGGKNSQPAPLAYLATGVGF